MATELHPAPRGAEAASPAPDPVEDSILIDLEISPELDDAWEGMAEDLDESRSEVFVRAMTLFRMALEARKAGKRVCIADDDLAVETEITGFGPLDEVPGPAATPSS